MEYSKEVYSEVYAILKLMSIISINKIPNEVWDNIDSKRDKSNNIEIVDLSKHTISEPASKLLAVIYKNYFATQEEIKVIKAKEKSILKEKNKIAKEKYDVDNIFEKENANKVENEVKEELIVRKKENVFVAFMNRWKVLFKGIKTKIKKK